MKQANRDIVLVVLALLLLSLTRSARFEQSPRPAGQRTYVYYFPTAGLSDNLSVPNHPVTSKRGIGLTHGECADQFGSWGYDWSGRPPACNMETVPMAWSGLPGILGGNSQWLMGFNEPDRPDQSNLSPERAATLWAQIEERYPDRKLVAPAPSHLHPEWIVDFRDTYIAEFDHPPRLDALALHCYLQSAAQCVDLTDKFIGWAQAWNVPGGVWVSEFNFGLEGGRRSEIAAWAQAQVFIDWMNAMPAVSRFAWFASRVNGSEPWAAPLGWNTSLLNPDDSLTFWGLHYGVK